MDKIERLVKLYVKITKENIYKINTSNTYLKSGQDKGVKK